MKVHQFILLLLCLCSPLTERAQSTSTSIDYSVDLDALDNDKLTIEMNVHSLDLRELTFSLPAIVPGIYGKMNYGQWISDVQAIDAKGNQVEVVSLDGNRWSISSKQEISMISYQVDDGWEEFDMNMERGFYRSASSSFAAKRHVIACNSLFGYIEGHAKAEIKIEVSHPEGLYGATALKTSRKTDTDVFFAKDYHELVDSPILYGEADTTSIHLEDITVEVACYSTTGEKISKAIADHISPLLEAQRDYLGGQLPVEQYSFIIYHNPSPDEYAYLGDGLEHSHSTLILLCVPLNEEIIKANVYGIASHEFFHTVMPLGIHSHEIANYDFNAPEMSKHLWLYEGMTEYFTIHMPVKQGLESIKDFNDKVSGKIKEMQEFDNTISMTQLSINAMDMQDQYYNVYLRGSLINLCLDIELRQLSDGEYGVQDLVQALLKKYGPEQSFADDELFDVIVELTGQPKLRKFIEDYIEGTTPLPISEYLASVGMSIDTESMAVQLNENPTKSQLALRKSWLGKE